MYKQSVLPFSYLHWDLLLFTGFYEPLENFEKLVPFSIKPVRHTLDFHINSLTAAEPLGPAGLQVDLTL